MKPSALRLCAILPAALVVACNAPRDTVASVVTARETPARAASTPLFPPAQLGMLEGPDRDEWQQPQRVMDALGIADGSRVADLGAGGGWFTIRLAQAVGPNGTVYAEDIQREMIASIERRVQSEGLHNVETVLGTPTDPRLPSNALQAILLVDLYGQLGDPTELLRNASHALAPSGRLGIVDFKRDGYGPGPAMDRRVEPDTIVHDAARAGLRLASRENFLRYQYLLVFTK